MSRTAGCGVGADQGQAQPDPAGLLGQLRGAGLGRPELSPGTAAGLHGQLAAELGQLAGGLPAGTSISVTKYRISRLRVCERFATTTGQGSVVTPELVLGLLADRVFAQVLAGYPLGPDPLQTALRAAQADQDQELLRQWEQLDGTGRATVSDQVGRQSRALQAGWPALPAGALPRLQDQVQIPFAGGRVVLNGRMDLVLGDPAGPTGVCLLDVKSGRRRSDDAGDAGWYALLETLRSGVPPARTGSLYLSGCVLDLDTVTGPLLQQAADRVVRAVAVLVRLALGEQPRTNPGPMCRWCPALPGCEPGRDNGYTRAPAGPDGTERYLDETKPNY
jgi:hypothetical protein